MSLDDLISAEKRRDRSPRRSHERAKRFATAFKVDERSRKQSVPMHAMIKVTNVPRELTWYDLKEAFQSVGHVERCDVDNGTAWVKFSDIRDAKNAIKEYDGGDLNGRIIRVSHA